MKGLLIGLGLGTLLGGAAVYIWTVGKRAEELSQKESQESDKKPQGEQDKKPIIYKDKEGSGVVDYTSFATKPVKKETPKSVVEEKEKEKPKKDIEVIPPDEFDINGEYETLSFTYFSDGVLVDDMGEPISETDAATLIGDALDHFGEYEDDSVYVRNDERKTFYEILYRYDTYSDYKESKPRRVELIE